MENMGKEFFEELQSKKQLQVLNQKRYARSEFEKSKIFKKVRSTWSKTILDLKSQKIRSRSVQDPNPNLNTVTNPNEEKWKFSEESKVPNEITCAGSRSKK